MDRTALVRRRPDLLSRVLDEQHTDHLRGLLERLCAAAEGQRAKHDGLCEALEEIESDAAADREDRRAAAGFVSEATARAPPSSPTW
ncbi:MAG: hypothetical protein ACQGVK_22580 [Myxococcota bacterium]